MSKHKDLIAFFHETLKRHRASRQQCGHGFGKMAKAATDPALREALQHSRETAEGEGDRVDAIFVALGKKPHQETCEITDAQLAAVKTMTGELKGGSALDDGLAAAAAALEGHAAGRLAVLRAWAGRLDLEDALPTLDRLRAAAEQSRDRFAALVGQGSGVPRPPDAGPVLTPKQAALIGLR